MGKSPGDVPSASRTFPAEPESVTRARHLVWQLLDEWALADVDPGTAGLLVSELVTNAVKHAGTPADVLVCFDGALRVEVTDRRADLPIAIVGDEELAVSGRGLRLVGQMASRWGYRRADDSKTIWFELDRGEPSA